MNTYLESIFSDIVIKGLIIGILGGAILTFFNENLNVLRTSLLISSAQRKLKTNNPKKIRRGAQMLLEIAISKPFRRQEMVDIIVRDCFRRHFSCNHAQLNTTPQPMIEVFVDTLKALLNIPRKDENNHLLNIDLHQLQLISEQDQIYLEKMNFKDVVLWGCNFVGVDLSRSNFENADLGGTYFKQCGVEFAIMDNAKMLYSFQDQRPTIFEETNLTGSTIEKANILDYPSPQLHFIRSPLKQDLIDALNGKSRGIRIS